MLVLAGAALLAPALARDAQADGGSCVDACVRNVGLTFEANGRFWILADCGTSELGTGTVWCKYTGYLLQTLRSGSTSHRQPIQCAFCP